jgi:divalent metal cation (Fe/Co/Zn/Cd) transporter
MVVIIPCCDEVAAAQGWLISMCCNGMDVGPVRLRWVGRTLRAECVISVDPSLSVIQAHAVAVSAEHALIHAVPRLAAAVVHADPLAGADHHALLADHALI